MIFKLKVSRHIADFIGIRISNTGTNLDPDGRRLRIQHGSDPICIRKIGQGGHFLFFLTFC